MASTVWFFTVDVLTDVVVAIAPPLSYAVAGMLLLWLSVLLVSGLRTSLSVFTAYWAVVFAFWGVIGVAWLFLSLAFSTVFMSTFVSVNGAASTIRTNVEHHLFNKHHHHRARRGGSKRKSRAASDDEEDAHRNYRKSKAAKKK